LRKKEFKEMRKKRERELFFPVEPDDDVTEGQNEDHQVEVT